MRWLAWLLVLLLAGCGQLQRISEIGRPPALTPSADPTADPNWRPLSMPMPKPQGESPPPNSLWRPGSRAFFKDQRAAQVGDLITVLVNTNDSAALSNQTGTSETSGENMGIPNFFGLETQAPTMISPGINVSKLVTTTSSNSFAGAGTLNRSEAVTLRLAGVVTQVLPNGNLVISARQEIRVNDELRHLEMTGVIRPEDIASDNTITNDRIAEARLDYGGRGTLTDQQHPRLGQQLFDVLLPF
jgi:flagellar L-ring protein FlgH